MNRIKVLVIHNNEESYVYLEPHVLELWKTEFKSALNKAGITWIEGGERFYIE